MEGIKGKLELQDSQQDSESKRQRTSVTGESVHRGGGERDTMATESDRMKFGDKKDRYKKRKVDDDEYMKDKKSSQLDRTKDDRDSNKLKMVNVKEKGRKDKGKEEKTAEVHHDNKRTEIQKKNETSSNIDSRCKPNRMKSEENIKGGKNGSWQNTSHEKCNKQKYTCKEKTGSTHNRGRDKGHNNEVTKRDETKEEHGFKTRPQGLHCPPPKKKTGATYRFDGVNDSLDTIDSERQSKEILKTGKNKRITEKEEHTARHKMNKGVEILADSQQYSTRVGSENTCVDASQRPSSKLVVRKDKINKKGRRNAEEKEMEQNKHTKTNKLHVSGKGTSKERVLGQIATPRLLAGAPRLRQLLTLSPQRHKGRIWIPLNLPEEPLVKVAKTVVNTADKQKMPPILKNVTGKKNRDGIYNDVQGKYKHHKKKFTEAYDKNENVKNREWETRRLTLLLGSRLQSPPNTCSGPSGKLESETANVQEQSHSKMEMSLPPDNLKENYHQLRAQVLTVSDTSTFGTLTTNEPKNDFVGSENSVQIDGKKKLGKRQVHVICKDTDEIQPEPSHKVWQNLGKGIPKLSTRTRQIEIVESGLSFAGKRKDKTPYLERNLSTPWNLDLISTPCSSKSSSKTPTDPTIDRSLEDHFGSQGGMQFSNTTSDHIPDTSLDFVNYDDSQKCDLIKSTGSIPYITLKKMYPQEIQQPENHSNDHLLVHNVDCGSRNYCGSIVDQNNKSLKYDSQFLHEINFLATWHKDDRKLRHVKSDSQVCVIDESCQCNEYTGNSLESSAITKDKSECPEQCAELQAKLYTAENLSNCINRNKLSSQSHVKERRGHQSSGIHEYPPDTVGCEGHAFRTEYNSSPIPINVMEKSCTLTNDMHSSQTICNVLYPYNMQGNSVELIDDNHHTRWMESSHDLEVNLTHKKPLLNLDITENVVRDLSEYEQKTFDDNLYKEHTNDSSLPTCENHARCHKEYNHFIILEKDNKETELGASRDSTCTGNKKIEQLKNLTANTTKNYEICSAYFLKESRRNLSFGDQGNRKGKDVVTRIVDLGENKRELLPSAAQDEEVLNNTSENIECSLDKMKQFEDIIIDLTLRDARLTDGTKNSRHSPSSAADCISKSIFDEVIPRGELEKDCRQPQTVNPELAAQHFRETVNQFVNPAVTDMLDLYGTAENPLEEEGTKLKNDCSPFSLSLQSLHKKAH
ncbi:hypothetical protein Hamer_G013428 [Homarus americanus]|uniref:Uncharacterized protein n=1 Tax=Homarus americanus TaxID=6706 RepID=A0A8J5KDT0_HOMAM|nr:hypothetical protein Hamer_G013428 [Homarus americanus]